MATKTYTKYALSGGGTGALDAIDGDSLADNYRAFVITPNGVYFYILDASSSETESIPAIIAPNDNPGNKRWVLKSAPAANRYYPGYFATDQGVTGDSDTITYYNDLISTGKGYIILNHSSASSETTYTLTTSETINQYARFEVREGAILDGAGTITFNSPYQIKAGDYQIFGSSITVEFTYPGVVNSKWFGLSADDSTNDTTTLQRATTSTLTAPRSILTIPQSDGIHLTQVVIPAGTDDFTIQGVGHTRTRFKAHSTHDGTESLFLAGTSVTTSNRVVFKNAHFYQDGSAYTDNLQCAAVEGENINNMVFDNCQWNRFQHAVLATDLDDLNFTGYIKMMACGYPGSGMGVIHLDGCNTMFFIGHTIERSYEYGIYLTKTGATECNGIHIQNNKIHGRTSGDEGPTLGKSLIVVDGANMVNITGNNISNAKNEPAIVVRDEDGSTAGTHSRTHTTICNNVIEGEISNSMIYVDIGDPLSRVIIDNNQFPDEFSLAGAALKVGANVLPMNIHWGAGNSTNEEDEPGDWIIDNTSDGWGGKIAFTFEKDIDTSSAQRTFTVLTVPDNMTLVPEVCNMKFNTTITGTTDDYIGLGVNDSDQRIFCGVSGICVANSYNANNYRRYYPASSVDSPPVVGGDIIKLLVVDSNLYDAGQHGSNTLGGSGESITVSISGYLLSNHP